jgi:acyl-CoA thioester hydrolase
MIGVAVRDATGFMTPIAIEPADIDHMGHVNNAVYLSWAQKVAIDFWHSVAGTDMISSLLWVAKNHNVEYFKPAFLGDTLTGFLTFKRFKGVRVLFHLEVRRGHDILACIESWWCSVDANTHRPTAVAKSFLEEILSKHTGEI